MENKKRKRLEKRKQESKRNKREVDTAKSYEFAIKPFLDYFSVTWKWNIEATISWTKMRKPSPDIAQAFNRICHDVFTWPFFLLGDMTVNRSSDSHTMPSKVNRNSIYTKSYSVLQLNKNNISQAALYPSYSLVHWLKYNLFNEPFTAYAQQSLVLPLERFPIALIAKINKYTVLTYNDSGINIWVEVYISLSSAATWGSVFYNSVLVWFRVISIAVELKCP